MANAKIIALIDHAKKQNMAEIVVALEIMQTNFREIHRKFRDLEERIEKLEERENP